MSSVSGPAQSPALSTSALPGNALDLPIPLDDTAEAPLVPQSVEDAIARRAELLMLVQRERDQTRQAQMDRVRSDFDNQQEVRAENLREMNSLRDLAMEQMKKDDEVLKKLVALI